MARVSVILSARKEKYLPETLEDLYEKRAGQIEVILTLDGPTGYEYEIPEYPRLKVIKNKTAQGLRNCTNEAVKVATGKYIMKIDAHCQIGESWDTILQQDCEDNWIVVPRRYWLDAPGWYIKDKPYNDAISLQYPFLLHPYRPQLTGRPDWVRQERDKDKLLVEDMSFQGSCWFMTKAHFNRIGGADPGLYGTFGSEPEEIGLNTTRPVGGERDAEQKDLVRALE